MTVTNSQSGTSVFEIAPKIYRISTPVPPGVIPGGFTFNQFLIVDDAPLLFHTGPRKMFPLVQQAVAHVLGDAGKLRYVNSKTMFTASFFQLAHEDDLVAYFFY